MKAHPFKFFFFSKKTSAFSSSWELKDFQVQQISVDTAKHKSKKLWGRLPWRPDFSFMDNVTLHGEKPGCRHLGNCISKKGIWKKCCPASNEVLDTIYFPREIQGWSCLQILCLGDYFFFHKTKSNGILKNSDKFQPRFLFYIYL